MTAEGQRRYVRRKSSDVWHWCTMCSNYPFADPMVPGSLVIYEYKGYEPRPTTGGELCNQCLSKEKHGACNQLNAETKP